MCIAIGYGDWPVLQGMWPGLGQWCKGGDRWCSIPRLWSPQGVCATQYLRVSLRIHGGRQCAGWGTSCKTCWRTCQHVWCVYFSAFGVGTRCLEWSVAFRPGPVRSAVLGQRGIFHKMSRGGGGCWGQRRHSYAGGRTHLKQPHRAAVHSGMPQQRHALNCPKGNGPSSLGPAAPAAGSRSTLRNATRAAVCAAQSDEPRASSRSRRVSRDPCRVGGTGDSAADPNSHVAMGCRTLRMPDCSRGSLPDRTRSAQRLVTGSCSSVWGSCCRISVSQSCGEEEGHEGCAGNGMRAGVSPSLQHRKRAVFGRESTRYASQIWPEHQNLSPA